MDLKWTKFLKQFWLFIETTWPGFIKFICGNKTNCKIHGTIILEQTYRSLYVWNEAVIHFIEYNEIVSYYKWDFHSVVSFTACPFYTRNVNFADYSVWIIQQIAKWNEHFVFISRFDKQFWESKLSVWFHITNLHFVS